MQNATTRRELVRGGIAVGLAGTILAAGRAAASGPSDVQIASQALELEQLLVVAYRQVLAAPVLTDAARSELRRLFSQERQHVKALERWVTKLGAAAPNALPSLGSAQASLTHDSIPWSLTALDSQRACLKLLIDVETVAENAYFSAIGKLSDPGLLSTCTEIMGCEAQHWTVLSALLNHGDATRSVPYPFVGDPG